MDLLYLMHPDSQRLLEATVVIRQLRYEFKFPAFFDFGFISNNSFQMILLYNSNGFLIKKQVCKFELSSQLQTFKILTNDVQVLILWLSYTITTVTNRKEIRPNLIFSNLTVKRKLSKFQFICNQVTIQKNS